jgi:hypothetical protein
MRFAVLAALCGYLRFLAPKMIVRLDPEKTEKLLSERHARAFDLTGRPMKGWLLVAGEGVVTDAALGTWIDVATSYAGSLPAK